MNIVVIKIRIVMVIGVSNGVLLEKNKKERKGVSYW